MPSVVAERVKPVDVFVTVTTAPGRAPPWSSVTVPDERAGRALGERGSAANARQEGDARAGKSPHPASSQWTYA